MHSYTPPRRRGSAGIFIAIFLIGGFFLTVALVVGGVAFAFLARSQSVGHARVVVERERAVHQMRQARARAERVPLPVPHVVPEGIDPQTISAEVPPSPRPETSIRVANREITIELDHEGKITLDSQIIESKQLEPLLRQAGEGRERAVSVVIKADKQCRFEHVASVLAVCQDLDIPNVHIATSATSQQ